MNILFFLKPKSEVVFLSEKDTLRAAIEVMEYHRYSAIPILSSDGKYIGTLSEGDILWYIKQQKEFNIIESEDVNILKINRHKDNTPIRVSENMDNLIIISRNENFVPVIDDRDMFIGIITRQEIIDYFFDMNKAN